MSFIGNRPDSFGYSSTSYDHFSGTGSQTVYTLTRSVSANADIFVTVNNVPQDPGVAYYVTNLNTLTFTSAPSSVANNIVIVYRNFVQSGIAPGANTVTTYAIAPNAVQAYQISSVSNTSITGNIVSSQITSVANTQITGLINSNQISSVTTTQLTGQISVVQLDTGSATGNGSIIVPIGTTGQRPVATAGAIRYNTTLSTLESANGVSWANVGSGSATSSGGGGISWQAVQSSNFIAVAGNGYGVNTATGNVVVTLPSSPTVGQQIQIIDYARNFSSNNLTIYPNGLKIQGNTSNVSISTNGQSTALVYYDTNQGWLPYSSGYALGPYLISYLVVAGGGSGGGAGGGGAGGVLSGSATTVTPGTTYSVTVGAGGAALSTNGIGNNGINSSLSTFATAIGGGGGGTYGGGSPAGVGSGGSGGGGGWSTVGAQGGGSGTSGQGNPGGSNSNTTGNPYPSGGGGGAGAVGGNSNGGNTSGNGGIGVLNTIAGSSYYWGGGGGGGSQYSGGTMYSGNGGLGGGGSGLNWAGGGSAGTAGTSALNSGGTGSNGISSPAYGGSGGTNTGGGGGGMGITVGNTGAGGSGVVIISYPAPQKGSGGTVSFSAGQAIHTFLSSGTFTA